jgi:hypothetical protein
MPIAYGCFMTEICLSRNDGIYDFRMASRNAGLLITFVRSGVERPSDYSLESLDDAGIFALEEPTPSYCVAF